MYGSVLIIYVDVISSCFGSITVRSGSFVYDADLKTQHWQPTPVSRKYL